MIPGRQPTRGADDISALRVAVACVFGVTPEDIASGRKFPRFISARRAFCWIARNRRFMLKRIAANAGMRGHPAVVFAAKRAETIAHVDVAFAC